MSGGVAQNAGIIRALQDVLGTEVAVPDNTQLMGALGAALHGYRSVVGKQRG